MKLNTISFSIALILCLTPAFADTSSSTSLQVQPSNTQNVNPTTNQNASTANVSTQVNNQNLGANSFGAGVTCQSAQIALGGFGARQSSGVGLPNSDAGVTVQYLTPVGAQGSRSCQSLANEILHQRLLDTQLTFISKCADFARAGIVLDPAIYPELARQCVGVHIGTTVSSSAPVSAYPSKTSSASFPIHQMASIHRNLVAHLSDFSPQHNSELRRIALHRIGNIAQLMNQKNYAQSGSVEKSRIAMHLHHEKIHLSAIISEYRLENMLLHKIASDTSWHARAALRQRLLSFN